MLTLRRGSVAVAQPAGVPMQRLEVELAGKRRPALADVGLVGESEVGDDVVVNTAALDLRLGSGGFDVVHVNLTRGLGREGVPGAHVMKLNYTSLQHAILPVEAEDAPEIPPGSTGAPVAVIFLHGQLAPLAWAASRRAPGARIGFVQTWGGALPGGLSDAVRELRERELLAGHITAGPAYGGEEEAISTAGAIANGLAARGWDAAVCGPGPGILGSGSALGHGGLSAFDSANAALALGSATLVVPRMSSADGRERHRGLSHHSATVLGLIGKPVVVPVPQGEVDPAAVAGEDRHERRPAPADLDGYRASGLPATTMGRGIEEDPLFFAAALAGGSALAGMIRTR